MCVSCCSCRRPPAFGVVTAARSGVLQGMYNRRRARGRRDAACPRLIRCQAPLDGLGFVRLSTPGMRSGSDAELIDSGRNRAPAFRHGASWHYVDPDDALVRVQDAMLAARSYAVPPSADWRASLSIGFLETGNPGLAAAQETVRKKFMVWLREP